MAQSFPPLPSGFRPEVLRVLNMKEFLVVAAKYGLQAIGERMQFDEKFLQNLQKMIQE